MFCLLKKIHFSLHPWATPSILPFLWVVNEFKGHWTSIQTGENIYLLVLLVVVFQIPPVHLFLAIGLLIHATLMPCFLTIISLQRRIVLNSQLQPTSPVCGLSFQTRSGIILFYIACRLLKNILKVTLLKLAMLSWSWTPNLFYFLLQPASPGGSLSYNGATHPR